MRVEKISETSIEIFLTQDDLMERKITTEDLLSGDIKTQTIVYELISEAEIDHNITIKSNGLFKMNLLNHHNGDISIIISAIQKGDKKIKTEDLYEKLYKQLEDNMPMYNDFIEKYTAKDIEEKISRKLSTFNKNSKTQTVIYLFNNLKGISDLLGEMDFKFKDERVYKLQNEYYLILELKSGTSKKKIETLLNEFATPIIRSDFELILQEYGEKIIKSGAKKILYKYF